MALAQAMATKGEVGVSIDVTGAYKTFEGGVDAVRDVSFSVSPGQFVAILGPSGCGKTTLLRLMAGLERLSAGGIAIDGKPASAQPRSFDSAFVFQDAHLLPWRNVLRNVEVPLELMGMPGTQRRALATQAIREVGLADAIARYPMQLSGGMRMRVSLARALVTRPRLLLLDEPFAAIDEFTRYRLDEQLRELWSMSGMTVIFVTHSISEATFLAQRAIVLSRRPARVTADIAIGLPAARNAELRTQGRFAEAMAELHKALKGQENE